MIIGSALVACSMLCGQALRFLPTGKLEVWFLNVGQGDAILLQSPSGKRILVDGGPDAAVLRELGRHLPFLSRRLDLVVLTHPDSDHAAGILEVLRAYDVRAILIARIPHETETYRSILREIASQNIPVTFPNPAIDIRFDDGLLLDVVWPTADALRQDIGTNNRGIVLRAMTYDRSLLLTGDIEERSERALLKTGQELAAESLKVAHHGSKTSTSTGFLLAASPKRVFISSGRKNSFGHPHAVVLERFKNFGLETHNTGWEGEGRY